MHPKTSILPARGNLSTSYNKLVNFIKSQQASSNHLSFAEFADLLQLVETTCNKPVDNKFRQSTGNKSIDNLQQTCHQQAVASHANES